MRIIEPGPEAAQDYAACRDKGMSCTVRPLPDFPAEDYVKNFLGEPSCVIWNSINGKMVGWAIPYSTLAYRAQVTEDALSELTDPGLSYVDLNQGFTIGHVWIKRRGGELLTRDMLPEKTTAKKIDAYLIKTIFGRALTLQNIMRANLPLEHLTDVVLFSGCLGVDPETLAAFRAYAPEGVRILQVFFRSHTGLISKMDLSKEEPRSFEVGKHFPWWGVNIDREGHIHVRGAAASGVVMLEKDRATEHLNWVPTFVRGKIDEDGSIFVYGELNAPADDDKSGRAKKAQDRVVR